MKYIWKYPVDLAETFKVDMPIGGKVLCVQVQGGKPVIWVEVFPEHITVSRIFHVRVTGGEAWARGDHYIGTFQLGDFVGHLYEEQSK